MGRKWNGDEGTEGEWKRVKSVGVGDRGAVESSAKPFSSSLVSIVSLGVRSGRREGEGSGQEKKNEGERGSDRIGGVGVSSKHQ